MSLDRAAQGKTGAGARSVDDRACRRTDQPRPGDRRRRSRAEHEARFRGGARRPARPCGQIVAGDAEGDRHDAGDEGRRRFRAAGRHLLHGARQGASGSSRRAPISSRRRTRRSTRSRRAGKSEAGQKTMLDVLVPVQAVFAGGGDARAIAAEAAQAADRRRRCWRSAAAPPSSANARSVIWTRARARRPC